MEAQTGTQCGRQLSPYSLDQGRQVSSTSGSMWTLPPLNPLAPNDLYISRTTPLTSKRCILYIYSTNVGTEYFKHALYSPFLT